MVVVGRGKFLVVGYDRAIGFYLVDRTDEDTDIIRVRATSDKSYPQPSTSAV